MRGHHWDRPAYRTIFRPYTTSIGNETSGLRRRRGTVLHEPGNYIHRASDEWTGTQSAWRCADQRGHARRRGGIDHGSSDIESGRRTGSPYHCAPPHHCVLWPGSRPLSDLSIRTQAAEEHSGVSCSGKTSRQGDAQTLWQKSQSRVRFPRTYRPGGRSYVCWHIKSFCSIPRCVASLLVGRTAECARRNSFRDLQ